jgi:hypothetical protein
MIVDIRRTVKAIGAGVPGFIRRLPLGSGSRSGCALRIDAFAETTVRRARRRMTRNKPFSQSRIFGRENTSLSSAAGDPQLT